MYTKLSREKERISAMRWGDTKKRRRRKEKEKRKRRSRHPNECDIVAIRRTAASFVRRTGLQLSSPIPPPPPSSTLANSSLTRLWNKLAVLGLFQRTMEKEGFRRSEGSPEGRWGGLGREMGWHGWDGLLIKKQGYFVP